MTKEVFIQKLRNLGFDLSIICWEPSVRDDVFCIYKEGNEWTIYYQERGKIFNKKNIKTETDAIDYLYGILI